MSTALALLPLLLVLVLLASGRVSALVAGLAGLAAAAAVTAQALPEREPHPGVFLALEALTDFENWGRMRELYGLEFEQAAQVWIRAFDRLLPPTPAES